MAIAIGIVVITAVIETVLIVKASAKKPQENATLIVLGCKYTANMPAALCVKG